MTASTHITVFGKSYKIRSESFSVDPQQVADLVDKKMRELSGARGGTSTTDLAVLTALNIAHEFLEAKQRLEDTENSTDQGLDRLIQIIEKEFENIKS